MTTLSDLAVSAAINTTSALAFLLVFALLRLQPINDRVYFPKWYLKCKRQEGTKRNGARSVSNIINLDWKGYLHLLDWTKEALKMPEPELIEHAGLDSAIYLRIYLLGLRLFVPMFLLSAIVLFPINATDDKLQDSHRFLFSNIDKLSISNVKDGSKRLWAHICMSYIFTGWICVVLFREYEKVMLMRLGFNDAQRRRPDHFTVLVKNIPIDPDESLGLHVEHFFRVNHPDNYVLHQVVRNGNKLAKLVQKKKKLQNWMDYYNIKLLKNPAFRPTTKTSYLGLWGEQVDAIDYYTKELEDLTTQIKTERKKVLDDPKALLPVAFVSFKGRWGAAVAAQTQQTKNPTVWLTEWAPEPRDVYWRNLSIPVVELTIRKLVMAVAFFFLLFFFMIPITFVQSLANLKGLSEKISFLKPIQDMKFVSSFLQGFLPGLALKIFLLLLPTLLMFMSKIEGYTSFSSLERRSAGKYFIFLVVTVFFGSIFTGTASQQLSNFVNESPSEIPSTIGNSVGQKALFFVTYIMVDGWASIAAEILRLQPLILFHLKNTFLVKTERDRKKAMHPGSICLDRNIPKIELYFLLGIMYAELSPILLPFIIVYFGFSYLVYRYQVINVYDQRYESAGAFWPHLHTRIIICLLIQQISMIGLLATKSADKSTPMLIVLPILTHTFHLYCKNRFEPAFSKYPLAEAMAKDTLERAVEPHLNIKSYLQDTYMHPVFKEAEDTDSDSEEFDQDPPLVPLKHSLQDGTPVPSASSATQMIIRYQ
ncbi:hypothetical protein GOP47_0008618 [Adiantum capillus-veneris]|uniref:Uncharacterized protein n=1 Tax=Adiantum capillus-veneris TaxID=13818 RepID=A0A9D4ZI79_ADICA|nr:hypothetical protein GOP47_0008618 [Adiantum capillus-veneris]